MLRLPKIATINAMGKSIISSASEIRDLGNITAKITEDIRTIVNKTKAQIWSSLILRTFSPSNSFALKVKQFHI